MASLSEALLRWQNHRMIMEIYAKLTEEREQRDTSNLDNYTRSRFNN